MSGLGDRAAVGELRRLAAEVLEHHGRRPMHAEQLAEATLRYLTEQDDAPASSGGLAGAGVCDCGHPVAMHGESGVCWADVLSWLAGRDLARCGCQRVTS